MAWGKCYDIGLNTRISSFSEEFVKNETVKMDLCD